ncbi:hypothetical protein [Cupriavidus pauculus]|uniref:hypothetical protein n=1 Tax=Cupriavidus pauculus TaxID=82633 RepID=UPI001D0CD121|nr:hypothetical protein [Cupriavidus pauculus]
MPELIAERTACLLEAKADKLETGKRVPQADRHVADVLRRAAAEIRALQPGVGAPVPLAEVAAGKLGNRLLWHTEEAQMQTPVGTLLYARPADCFGTREPLRGESIAATWSHDAGAYARCSYCGRYSDSPLSLSKDSFPCDCGKLHGWSGSFKKPEADAKWSEAK